MALPLAIPLAAPIAPGAVAAAATFAVGTVAHVAQQVYGFRAPLPPLPRATGRVGEETLQELIADAIAGARVPVALPPSPFGPRGNLAAAGLQALAWAWGLLNTRKKPGPVESGLVELGFGKYMFTKRLIRSISAMTDSEGNVTNPAEYLNQVTGGVNTNNTYGLEFVGGTYKRFYRTGPGIDTLKLAVKPGYRTKRADGTWTDLTPVATVYEGTKYNNFRNFDFTETFTLEEITKDGINVTPIAVPENPDLEQITPQPLTLPPFIQPLAPPTPQIAPETVPEAEPLTQPTPTTPAPVAPPIVRPATPYSPQPPKVPSPTAISNGTLIAPAPVPVPTTPQDAVFPVPGGLPVTGRTMTPTIQAVAQEVGRIEQKIDRMVNPTPGQWGDVPGAGDLIADAVKALVEAVIAVTSGTTYTLDSPCEVDEETGEKLPPVLVEAPGALTTFGTILNRFDAIAELIQVHKNLKQPNCKPKQPAGEFVTVNFEQID